MKPYDRVTEAIHGNKYLIHRSDEPLYAYLDEDDICIEVLNGNGENNMFIHMEGTEYTLFFGNNHEHFYIDEESELDCLIHCIEEIFHNKKGSASIFCYGENGQLQWLGSCFLTAEAAINDSVQKIFAFVYQEDEFRDKIAKNRGEARFCFWNDSLCKVTALPEENKADSL